MKCAETQEVAIRSYPPPLYASLSCGDSKTSRVYCVAKDAAAASDAALRRVLVRVPSGCCAAPRIATFAGVQSPCGSMCTARLVCTRFSEFPAVIPVTNPGTPSPTPAHTSETFLRYNTKHTHTKHTHTQNTHTSFYADEAKSRPLLPPPPQGRVTGLRSPIL